MERLKNKLLVVSWMVVAVATCHALTVTNPSFESPYVTPSPGWSSTVDDWDQWGGTGVVSGGNFQPSTPYGDQWAFLDYGGWAGQEGYLYQNVGIVENNTDYQITFLSGGDLSSAVASLTVQILAKTTVDQFWTWQVLDSVSVIVPEPSYMQENALTLNSGTGFSGNDLYILFKAGGDNDGVVRRALIDNVSIVPEPATLVLLGIGALSVLRRKNK